MAPGLLLELNRIAIRGLEPEAGKFRTIEVSITNTPHQPPPYADVSELKGVLEELLGNQLIGIFHKAGGNVDSADSGGTRS